MTDLKPKERLEQMIDFFDRRGKERGYNVTISVEPNEVELKYKNKESYSILLLHKTIPLRNLIGINWNRNDLIFYKDGKTFFRRMVEYNNSWRANKSLKKYSKKRINEIITLTIQERLALFKGDWYSIRNIEENNLKNKQLIYYQPPTEKLSEDLIFFKGINLVESDYSHLEENTLKKTFSKNGPFKTYFFLDQKKSN